MFIVVFHFIISLANSVWCLGGHTEEVVEKKRAYLFLNVIIIFLAELVASGVVIIV